MNVLAYPKSSFTISCAQVSRSLRGDVVLAEPLLFGVQQVRVDSGVPWVNILQTL